MPKSDARLPARTLASYVALGLAIVFAFAIGLYLVVFDEGNGGNQATPDAFPSVDPRVPYTPYPNTGVLQSQAPDIGKVAPDFALVDARDGRTIRKLSDYRGKAVILNFYASWCGPCKQEIPEYQAAMDALPDRLVVLAVDYLEEPERAAGILLDLNATFPAVLDTNGDIAAHYQIGRGLPVTYFVDADGVLRAKHTGQVPGEDLPGYLQQVGLKYERTKR